MEFINVITNEIKFFSDKTRRIIIFLIFLLTLIFGYFFDLRFLWQRFDSLIIRQNKLNSALSEMNSKVAAIPRIEKEVAGSEMQYANYARYAVNDFTFADTLKDLAHLAEVNHFTLVGVYPEVSKLENEFMLYPLRFNAVLTYKQALQFFVDLNKLKYLAKITRFSLQNTADRSSLILDAEFVAYKSLQTTVKYQVLNKFRKNAKTAADIGANRFSGLAPKTKSIHDPFATAAIDQGYDLHAWSVAELRFIGVIQQNNQIWAIISDPLGNIYRVTSGMSIGAKHSKVVNITPQAVITDNPEDIIVRDAAG